MVSWLDKKKLLCSIIDRVAVLYGECPLVWNHVEIQNMVLLSTFGLLLTCFLFWVF